MSAERNNISANLARLTIAASNLSVARENYTAAASRILDVDVAEDSSQLVKK
jgi:flagellin-like hook-associated protein FlgL